MDTAREITTHLVEGHESVRVFCLDGPGAGGASHEYVVKPPDGRLGEFVCPIVFQDGSPKDGFNGVTNEALLAVLIDRLTGFQAGPFACTENSIALSMLQEAMKFLKQRTEQRIKRGVEGQAKP